MCPPSSIALDSGEPMETAGPPQKRLRLEATLPEKVPHARAECPIYVFWPPINAHSQRCNFRSCPSCHCFVCDRPVEQCPIWSLHCMAYYFEPLWRQLKEKTRSGRNVLRIPKKLLPETVLDNRRLKKYIAHEPLTQKNNSGVIDLDADSQQPNTVGKFEVAPVPAEDVIVIDSDDEAVPVTPGHAPADLNITRSNVDSFSSVVPQARRSLNSRIIQRPSHRRNANSIRPSSILSPSERKLVTDEYQERMTSPSNITSYRPTYDSFRRRTGVLRPGFRTRMVQSTITAREQVSSRITQHGNSGRQQNNNNVLSKLRQLWDINSARPPTVGGRIRNQSCSHSFGLPQRILVGHIDLWRPYCSHMSVRSLDHQLGKGDNDTSSYGGVNSMRISGYSAEEAKIIALELGLDLGSGMRQKPGTEPLPSESDSDSDSDSLCELRDKEKVEELVYYASRDKKPIQAPLLLAIKRCIEAGHIEVRWSLAHYDKSNNTAKAFAYKHDLFSKVLDVRSRAQVFVQTDEWIKQREACLALLTHFDTSNCCLLRAHIYVAPKALGSVSVMAASFCDPTSAYAHMVPLDARRDFDRSKPSKRMPWSTLEMNIRESENMISPLFGIMKPATVASRGSTADLSHTSSILSAAVTNGSSTFESLCRTNKHDVDIASIESAKRKTRHLQELCFKRQRESGSSNVMDAMQYSEEFTVSNGYLRASTQPGNVRLPLRLYQRESLAWMEDQEKKRSISDPFWIEVPGFSPSGGVENIFYCPLTGSLSRFRPPPIVGGILAEEMGLGKTIIVISLINNTLQQARQRLLSNSGQRRDLILTHATLIVCPVSLLKQWEEEFKTKLHSPLKVLSWYGGSRPTDPSTIAENDVVLTTYGILSNKNYHPLTNINWYRVVIDESTYVNGGGSSCGAVLIGKLISSRRWAVSGTPFGNSFNTFLGTLRFLGVVPFSRSKHFTRLADVANETVHAIRDIRDIYALPQLAYLLKNIMMRHVKEQTFRGSPLVDLPPASGRLVSISHYPDEHKKYLELESRKRGSAICRLRGEALKGPAIVELFAMIRPLRMMADGVVPIERDEMNPKASKIEKQTVGFSAAADVKPFITAVRSAKIQQLLSDISKYRAVDPTAKFVVFTEFQDVKRAVQATLSRHGHLALTLDGSMTGVKRGKVIKQFAEDMDAVALVLSMRLGACGLTLTMANVVVLFEVGLDIAGELQAVNRIHRIGQTRPVETLTYMAKDTIDERIAEVRELRGQPRVVFETVTSVERRRLSKLEEFRILFGCKP